MHRLNHTNPPRDLQPHERDFLDRLVLQDFPGSAALAEQAELVKVAEECGCGCPSIIFAVEGSAPKATVLQRVPVEADSKDVDGMGLHILLHVVDGVLRELEIFREDSEPVKKLPAATSLAVSVFRPAAN